MSSAYITYSNESKIREVNVPADFIDEYGVVSPQVAEAMARGQKARSGADIAVSVTGYAGPEADPGHEAGEAYIGYAIGDKTGYMKSVHPRNDRKWNRNYYLLRMLRAVYMLIR